MKVSSASFELKFQHPFAISKGVKTHQPTFVVQLDHLGRRGFGEAPAISYYNITTRQMQDDLERKKLFVEKFAFTEPDRWWHYLHHLFPQNGFLVCALDMAGWDLYGKFKNKTLKEFWTDDNRFAPVCDFTIGIDSIDTMIGKMLERPWPVYKIKLGTDHDVEIIRSLRKQTRAVFRIDANAAWTAEEAFEKINEFARLGVELVEQPLTKDDWTGMRWLFERSPLPLFADESCVFESDVMKCVGHFHGINIKLTKCTGITPALRMIKQARNSGLQVMIGSMNESSVGSAALAHLSHLADFLDADGPLLLTDDLATGLTYRNDGEVLTSDQPGLGISFTGLVSK